MRILIDQRPLEGVLQTLTAAAQVYELADRQVVVRVQDRRVGGERLALAVRCHPAQHRVALLFAARWSMPHRFRLLAATDFCPRRAVRPSSRPAPRPLAGVRKAHRIVPVRYANSLPGSTRCSGRGSTRVAGGSSGATSRPAGGASRSPGRRRPLAHSEHPNAPCGQCCVSWWPMRTRSNRAPYLDRGAVQSTGT